MNMFLEIASAAIDRGLKVTVLGVVATRSLPFETTLWVSALPSVRDNPV
jgi:hypothetical protein